MPRSLPRPQPALLTAFVQIQAPKVFRQFEHLLKKASAQGYFVYAYVRPVLPFPRRSETDQILLQPSFAEFHILYNVENITTLRPDILAEFPLLAAWREKMNARKGINAYLVSGRQNTIDRKSVV